VLGQVCSNDGQDGLFSLLTKQALSDITIKILFLPASCMDDCSQGNLTGSIDHVGISKEDRVKEGLDLRPEAVHTGHCELLADCLKRQKLLLLLNIYQHTYPFSQLPWL
jgi:hypothetical protein